MHMFLFKVNSNSCNFMYIDGYISFVSTSQLEIQKYSIPIRVTWVKGSLALYIHFIIPYWDN